MENEEKRLEYGEWENTKGNLKWDMYNGQQRAENGEWRADFHQCCDSETCGFLDGEGCERARDLERFSCQALSHRLLHYHFVPLLWGLAVSLDDTASERLVVTRPDNFKEACAQLEVTFRVVLNFLELVLWLVQNAENERFVFWINQRFNNAELTILDNKV